MQSTAVIPSNILKRALQTVSPAIGKNQALTVIEDVKIDFTATQARFTATNLSTTITTLVDLPAVNDECQMCVPYDHLKKICDVLPDNAPITLTYNDKDLNLKLTCDGDKHSMVVDKVADFPAAMQPKADYFNLPGDVLRAMRIAVKFCSVDTLRPAMTGVYFEGHQGLLKLVSTNAHQLYRSAPIAVPEDQTMEFVVPAETMKIVSAMSVPEGEQLQMSFTEAHAFFKAGTTSVSVRLIDARFPDYKAVIPDFKTNFLADRNEFRNTLRSVGVSASNTTHQVRIKLDDSKITFSATDADFGKESLKEIEAISQDCNPIEFAMNHKLLTDVLAAVDGDQVKIHNELPTRAFIFSGANDDLFLQMPLMVGV